MLTDLYITKEGPSISLHPIGTDGNMAFWLDWLSNPASTGSITSLELTFTPPANRVSFFYHFGISEVTHRGRILPEVALGILSLEFFCG